MVNLSLTWVEARAVILTTLETKQLTVDAARGMLFCALQKGIQNMLPIDDTGVLHEKLANSRKGVIPQMVIGAADPDHNPQTTELTAEDRKGALVGLCESPEYKEDSKEKSRNVCNIDLDGRRDLLAWINSCYNDPHSPWHHAFTAYHRGVICRYLEGIACTRPTLFQELMTDWRSGEIPKAQDFNKYCSKGD
jgi:hypothetical protein